MNIWTFEDNLIDMVTVSMAQWLQRSMFFVYFEVRTGLSLNKLRGV